MLLLALSLIEPAEACACCSEPDTYSHGNVDPALFPELQRLIFSPGRLSELGNEPSTISETLGIQGNASEPGKVTFTVAGPGRSQSTMVFTYSAASIMQVDNTPFAAKPAAEPALYTQVLVPGSLVVEGPLAAKLPTGPAELLLQGNGNFCLAAEMFYRWDLRFPVAPTSGEPFTLAGAGPVSVAK